MPTCASDWDELIALPPGTRFRRAGRPFSSARFRCSGRGSQGAGCHAISSKTGGRDVSSGGTPSNMGRRLRRNGSVFLDRVQGGTDGLQREQKGKRGVQKGDGPETGVPFRRSVVLGVDEQGDAADLSGRPQTAPTGSEQKLSAKSGSLRGSVHRQSRKPKHWNFMARQAALHHGGGTFKR